MKTRPLIRLIIFWGILVTVSAVHTGAQPNLAVPVTTPEVIQPPDGPAYIVVERKGSFGPYNAYGIRALKIVADGSNTRQFNDLVLKFLDDEYSFFEEFSKQPTEPPFLGDSQFLGQALTIDFKLFAWSDDILSVRFDKWFIPGGFYHPPSSYVINYSLRTGKQLALIDLFNLDSDYANVVTAQIASYLEKQPLSAEQRKSALQDYVWNITSEGMVVTLNDAYLQRETHELPEVVIPSSALRQFVTRDSPLAELWDRKSTAP